MVASVTGLAYANNVFMVDRSNALGREPSTANSGKTPPTDPLTPRERRAMLVAAGVIGGAIVVGATIWITTSHSTDYERSGNGCVNVSEASSMGGAIEHACGQAAKDWCRAVSAQHDAHALAVQEQCRIARLTP